MMRRSPVVAAGLGLVLAACSGSSSARQVESDASTADGAGGGGGMTSGSGGRQGSGGASSAGGAVGTGSKGSTGGASSNGGASGTGGASNTGGVSNAGGASGSGGKGTGGAPSKDGGVSTHGDAGPDGGSTCDFGSAGSFATQTQLDLFGSIVYFSDGASLPAGRYRLSYVDGCMKYAGDQGWTIHAYAGGASAAWWIVGDTSAARITVPPGTVGYSTAAGAFTNFDDCVAANTALGPTEFDFEGGKLGVWLLDSNYGDNLAGVGGRNPRWQLTLLGACVARDH
jgi:hypothetical protein